MLTKSELEKNLERIHGWVTAADQKVSIFLAFQGIILTILFERIFLWTKENLRDLQCRSIILLIFGIILITYSIYKSISAIIPRLTKDKKKKSITYFGDIAEYNLENFKKAVKETSEDEYENELIEQIHISSKIAKMKHSQFKDAILAFFCGMTLLALSFLLFRL